MKISRYKTLLNQFLIVCRLKRKPVSNGFKSPHMSSYIAKRTELLESMRLCQTRLLDTNIYSDYFQDSEYEREVLNEAIDMYNQELLLLDAKKELKLIQA